jgi:hypothetical protein
MFVFSLVILLTFLCSFLYSLPEQIGLNYGSLTSQMVITWADFDKSATENCGIIEFGLSKDQLINSVKATGQTYTYQIYKSPMLYKAEIDGLMEGNKIYYYRVGSTKGIYSDIFSFKTHPGIGMDGVTFHMLGDVGQTVNSNSTYLEILENQQDIKGLSGGIISMGDLSYANGVESLWDSFGNMKQYVSTSIPMMSTVGNHEWFDDITRQFLAYKSRYDNPTINGIKELYYSFDSGLVHWVMVAGYCSEMTRSSTQPCLADDTDEKNWLIKDLASVDKSITPWTFVVFHQPYVNSNTAHNIAKEGKPMQEAIEDTLYDAKVDLVFSGHVHSYERSCQVYQYKCTAGAPYYINIGDGGNKEGLASDWVKPQPEWSAFRQASYGHGELNVVNSTHTLFQWHQNNDLSPVIADELWIIKGDNTNTNPQSITKQPVFANNDRGRRGVLFNEEALKEESLKSK